MHLESAGVEELGEARLRERGRLARVTALSCPRPTPKACARVRAGRAAGARSCCYRRCLSETTGSPRRTAEARALRASPPATAPARGARAPPTPLVFGWASAAGGCRRRARRSSPPARRARSSITTAAAERARTANFVGLRGFSRRAFGAARTAAASARCDALAARPVAATCAPRELDALARVAAVDVDAPRRSTSVRPAAALASAAGSRRRYANSAAATPSNSLDCSPARATRGRSRARSSARGAAGAVARQQVELDGPCRAGGPNR